MVVKFIFFNKHETIQHLFFDCHYACFLSHAVHWVFGIAPLKGPNGQRGMNSLLKISTTTLNKDVRQLNGEASVALAC